MTRRLATWIVVLAVCGVVLLGLVHQGIKAAQEYVPPFAFGTPGVGFVAGDKDCSDYERRAEAQQALESHPAQLTHQLDQDRDGTACERFPYD